MIAKLATFTCQAGSRLWADRTLAPGSHVRPALARLAAIAVALAALVSTGHAGTPPPLSYAHIYDFGLPYLQVPGDVAPFRAPNGWPLCVFVADRSTNGMDSRVLRFSGDGRFSGPPLVIPMPTQKIAGIAINEISGHCNRGQVYVSLEASSTGGGKLRVYTAAGDFLTQAVYTTAPAWKPGNVALDSHGNVWVMNSTEVLKFDASVFQLPLLTDISISPAQSYPVNRPMRAFDIDDNDRLYMAGDLVFTESWLQVLSPQGTQLAERMFPKRGLHGLEVIDRFQRCALSLQPWASVPMALETYVLDGSAIIGSDNVILPPGASSTRSAFTRYTYLSAQIISPPNYWTSIRRRSRERLFVCNPAQNVISVFGKSFASTRIPTNAVAFWRFEEGHNACASNAIVDWVGSHTGTMVGTADPYSGLGLCGRGLEFPAGNSGFVVADDAALDFGLGSFTIEFWVRALQTSGNVTILDKRGSNEAGYAVHLHNGELSFEVNGELNGQVNQSVFTPSAGGFVADGAWHHVAAVLDRSIQRELLYVDGVSTLPMQTGALPVGGLTNDGPLYVGRGHPGAAGAPYSGGLDELTIYGRVLSATEIDAIFSAESAGKFDEPMKAVGNHTSHL